MTDHQIEQEIQAKGLTAPRITPADIEANIVSEHYFTAAQGDAKAMEDGAFINGALNGCAMRPVPAELGLLTFCVLVLRNGFTVTGESACASPANFNAEIGRKIARDNAVAKIWPLQPIDTAPTDGTVFLGYRERDGRWGECCRVQRDDCEMWTFGGSCAADEEFPGFKPTHWMPIPTGKSPD